MPAAVGAWTASRRRVQEKGASSFLAGGQAWAAMAMA